MFEPFSTVFTTKSNTMKSHIHEIDFLQIALKPLSSLCDMKAQLVPNSGKFFVDFSPHHFDTVQGRVSL